jgi:transcriptional regulator with XRE-family HTH domain
MPDTYTQFVDAVIGNDPERRNEFRLAANRREAGRQIYSLRVRCGFSYAQFAQIVGLDDPSEMESLELGNSDGPGLERLLQVRKAVKDYQRRQARVISDIRGKLRMTQEDLAEYSGLSLEIIQGVEQSDFPGDWNALIGSLNRAFQTWITNVIVPTYQVDPQDYLVKVVNA